MVNRYKKVCVNVILRSAQFALVYAALFYLLMRVDTPAHDEFLEPEFSSSFFAARSLPIVVDGTTSVIKKTSIFNYIFYPAEIVHNFIFNSLNKYCR